MRNILLRTTFKDDLVLLKPFYNFYKDIWDPETYIFYIGYSKFTEADIIAGIESKLDIKVTYSSTGSELSSLIMNTKIYIHKNLYFVLYKSEANTPTIRWDSIMRPFLYKDMTGIPRPDGYKYYINVDNDDFFYVKDIDSALKTPVLKVHALEFISQEKFNLDNEMQFISSSYYYRLKGTLHKEVSIISNNHKWCRTLFLNEPYNNETHTGRSESCSRFDRRKMSFEEVDNVCFAFGCLDLDYLLNSKYWLQSEKDDISKVNYSREEIVMSFYDYYTLTEGEKANNLIIGCNWLKRYF